MNNAPSNLKCFRCGKWDGERCSCKDGQTLLCGDNCDILRTFPDECIDLVVTSPPYDDLREYGGHSWDFYGVAWNLARVIKEGGVIVWVVGDATTNGSETGASFRQAIHFQTLGMLINDTMIYEKAMFLPQNNSRRYEQCYEYMFVFSKGKPSTLNALTEPCVLAGCLSKASTQRQVDGTVKTLTGDGKPYKDTKPLRNIWKYKVGAGHSSEERLSHNHPAIFPENLARDHILSWSNEGDIVLDPFNGSGTTTKMAKHNGRRGIGIDVNEDYCRIAAERLRQGVLL